MKTKIAYCAINSETNEFFTGSKNQVAFSKIGSLKNSMNMANRYGNEGRYDYNDPTWVFYAISSEFRTLKVVAK